MTSTQPVAASPSAKAAGLPYPSYARDAAHAAALAAHIQQLVAEAPPFTSADIRRLKPLVNPQPVTPAAAIAA